MYEKTEWKKGDVVTSAKMNKIEKGIEDAGGGSIEYLGTFGMACSSSETISGNGHKAFELDSFYNMDEEEPVDALPDYDIINVLSWDFTWGQTYATSYGLLNPATMAKKYTIFAHNFGDAEDTVPANSVRMVVKLYKVN